jgi:hypothetical protein
MALSLPALLPRPTATRLTASVVVDFNRPSTIFALSSAVVQSFFPYESIGQDTRAPPRSIAPHISLPPVLEAHDRLRPRLEAKANQ